MVVVTSELQDFSASNPDSRTTPSVYEISEFAALVDECTLHSPVAVMLPQGVGGAGGGGLGGGGQGTVQRSQSLSQAQTRHVCPVFLEH